MGHFMFGLFVAHSHASVHARPLDSVILDSDISTKVYNDVTDFFQRKVGGMVASHPRCSLFAARFPGSLLSRCVCLFACSLCCPCRTGMKREASHVRAIHSFAHSRLELAHTHTLVNTLTNAILRSDRRGYLLYGPPGCGKTSFVTGTSTHSTPRLCVSTLLTTTTPQPHSACRQAQDLHLRLDSIQQIVCCISLPTSTST